MGPNQDQLARTANANGKCAHVADMTGGPVETAVDRDRFDINDA